MTLTAERNRPTNSVIDSIKFDIVCILDSYLFCRNNSNTHELISSEIETYLTGKMAAGVINQFVHSIDYGDNPTDIFIGLAIQPHETDSFIYSKVLVETVLRDFEDEIATILSEEIKNEIDREMMQTIVATAHQEGLEQISSIIAMPSDSVDDLAEVFDEISDEEFIDLIEVITENNEEYNKAQNDEAYKHAMGIL